MSAEEQNGRLHTYSSALRYPSGPTDTAREAALDIFVSVFLPMTLFVIMFSLGLGLVVGDFQRIVTHPKAFAAGLLSQMVILPVVGFALAASLGLTPELALGLVVLALCPGGATANIFTRIAHGDVALSISVMSVSTLLAVFTLPILVKVAAGYFLGVEAVAVEVTSLSIAMLALTIVPVCVAMAIRHFLPAFALSIERTVSRIAILLVVVVIGLALWSNRSLFIENLPILGPSVILLNVLVLFGGLGLGWLLSLEYGQTTAIALETGIKNGALGVTAGSLIIDHGGEISPISVPSGVYGITMYGVCIGFTMWRRSHAKRAQAQKP